MDEMVKHGNGTYDADKEQWKVRTKELKASATVRQRAEMFGEDLPNDERKTRPYWLKCLKINTTPNTDAQRKRLRPKKVKPPKLFPPTVQAVKEVVPNKLIPKSKPMTPLKPRSPLS